jgi:hypothetical protein
MGEFWVQKERDSELASPPSQLVFEGRNSYSFWSPLDREMLLCMVKLAHYKQYEFVDPFFTDYFFAYLDYTNMQPLLAGLSADAAASLLNSKEYQVAYAAINAGTLTNTGVAYKEYMSTSPPTLNLFPASGSALAFSWTPVAGKYLLEATSNLAAPASWPAQPIPARTVGGDYSASFAMTNRAMFFRLRLP